MNMKTSALIIGIMVGMCLNNPDHFDMCKAALVAALNEADSEQLMDAMTSVEHSLVPDGLEWPALQGVCIELILHRLN
jgi:hypothetical protein